MDKLMKWMPDRKVWVGGLTGIAAWVLATQLGMDMETATAVAGGVMMLVQYLVPPSVKDILKRVDDTVKDLGK